MERNHSANVHNIEILAVKSHPFCFWPQLGAHLSLSPPLPRAERLVRGIPLPLHLGQTSRTPAGH